MPSSDPDSWFEGLKDGLREHERSRSSSGGPVPDRRIDSVDAIRDLLKAALPKRYTLREAIGEGATAFVFRAWDGEAKRTVAVKVLRDVGTQGVARERFHREARLAQSLDHRNIVRVFDVREVEGLSFMVMEEVEGRSLQDLLKEGGRDRLRLLRWVEEAARGVAAAHGRGIVHRDLKPGNILVPENGPVKVADFGLARATEHQTRLTQTGVAMGTPLYMSPEQVAGRISEISERTDVYALGAVLYEVVTGRPPHESESIGELYVKIIREEITPPGSIRADVDPALETVIMKSLEKYPPWRYPDAGALADDLARVREGRPIEARPVARAARMGRKIAQRPLPLAVAAGVILVLAALATGALRSRIAVEAYQQAYQEGMEHWSQAISTETGRSPIVEERARTAVECFDRAAELDSSRPEPWLMIGRCRMLLGEEDEAVRAWDQALRRRTSYAPALLERGKYSLTRYARLRIPPTVRLGARGARTGRAVPESDEEREWRRRGEADLERLRGGPNLEAKEQEYLNGLLLYARGRFAEAAEAMETYVRENPWDARALAAAGFAAYSHGEFRRAAGYLEGAIRMEDRGEWHRARGDALLCAGDSAGALDAYEAALRKDPRDPETICNRGLALKEAGEPAEAERTLTEALALRPRFARALNARGTVRAEQGNLAGAIEDFEEAIFHDPRDVDAYNNLANVFLTEGRVEDALSQYDIAVELSRGNPDLQMNRGIAHRLIGNHPKAERDFAKVLELDPGHLEAGYLHALTRYDLGEKQEARAELLKVVQAAPGNWRRRPEVEELLRDWKQP